MRARQQRLEDRGARKAMHVTRKSRPDRRQACSLPVRRGKLSPSLQPKQLARFTREHLIGRFRRGMLVRHGGPGRFAHFEAGCGSADTLARSQIASLSIENVPVSWRPRMKA